MNLEINTVYNCDCRDLMDEMRRGGVKADWIITDPPYGIKIDKMGFTKGDKKLYNSKVQKRDYSQTQEWDRLLPKDYFDLMFSVSDNQLIFGGNYYANILPPTASWVVWDKRCNDKFRNDFGDCELAWCSKGVARVFHFLYNGMVQDNMKNKDERFHPTQKPLQLIMRLINYYTKEGDLILDPLMGSFTTAVACYKTGRRFIGAELDKEYFEKGMARLNAERSQVSIFDNLHNNGENG